MWRSGAILLLLAASACATDGRSEYEATPTMARTYSLRLSTDGVGPNEHKAQLASRASGMCGGSYDLAVENEIVSVCSDACADFQMVTIGTLSCGKVSG